MAMSNLEQGPSLAEAYYVTEEEGLTLLGRGKFSVVHRTRRRADELPVALKTIQIFEMGTKERHECLNEIRLLQSMEHRSIIRYLDCKMERNELTVVMELAGHGDLARLIRSASKAGTPSARDLLAGVPREQTRGQSRRRGDQCNAISRRHVLWCSDERWP